LFRNKATRATVVLMVFILFFTVLSMPVLAENEEEVDEDLEWRMELIEASRGLMEEEEKTDVLNHRLGTIFTNFPHDGARVNTGLRVMPQLISFEEPDVSLRFVMDLLYLRAENDFAGFPSLAVAVMDTVYIGAGGEIMGQADYQIFAGWEPMDNIFLELKAINSGGDLEDIEFYPALGFQIRF